MKYRTFPETRSFNNLMAGFLTDFPSMYRDDHATGVNQTVPVNIKELPQGYLLEVIAPGFLKDDFKIGLDKNILTISAEKKTEEQKTSDKFIRREHRASSFKRSFTLGEKIDTENIEAKYEGGVLVLNLQHKAEVKAPAKEITIQ